MKLNLNIIAEELSKNERVIKIGFLPNQLVLGRPLHYERGTEMKTGRLYIAQLSSLPVAPTIKDVALIIIGGNIIPQSWICTGVQILILPECKSISDATEKIIDIFDKYDIWEEGLKSIIEDYDYLDVERIFRLGAEMFDADIGFSDSNIHVLFSFDSEVNECEEGGNHFRDYTKESYTSLTLKSWENINAVCQIERKIKTPYLSHAPFLTQDTYCNNLFLRDIFSGCMYIISHNPHFSDCAFSIMDYYFVFLSKAMSRYMTTSYSLKSIELDALKDILEQAPLKEEFNEILETQDGEYWFMFTMRKVSTMHSLPREYMCENLNACMSSFLKCMKYKDEALGILRINQTLTINMGETLIFLSNTLSQMGYIAGISNSFTNLLHAEHYLNQARYAVYKGSLLNSVNNLFYFNDYCLGYLLEQCTSGIPFESVCPKGLLELKKHDTEKKSEYIKTLDTYLKCEMNASHAAEALYIHRSSFMKRLYRINKILNMNLEDPDTRLLIRMLLKLIITY